MAYPDQIRATLIECNGTSCENANHDLGYVEDSNPPEYQGISGDFIYARCLRINLGGSNYTWELTLYKGSNPCGGFHTLRLSTAADDPVGDYCKWTGSSTDCTQAKAKVVAL